MSTTTKNANTAFIIDTSEDLPYPLFMSRLPDAHEFIDEIPLSNINWDALEALSTPGSPSSEYEALLIPTDSARTVSVVVDRHVVGTLPDPTVVSDSQIARVYASGLIPTCTLRITPGDSILARVFLFKVGGGVPFNDPPEKSWTMLPSGSKWRVEPTRVSLFSHIPHDSQVFLELRADREVISVHFNGTECGVLDMEAADALCGAVQVAAKHNHLSIVQGYIEYHDSRQIFFHIDALAFSEWQPEDHTMTTNPREKLVPHSADPGDYLEALTEFVRDHEAPRDMTQERRESTLSWLQKISPFFLLFFSVYNLLYVLVVDDLSARGLVGILGMSFTAFTLGIWLILCQRRDTPRHRQSRHWNFLIPLSVSALIPSVVFANIGIFYDSQDPVSQTSGLPMTTLQNFPVFPGSDLTAGENPTIGIPGISEPNSPETALVTRDPETDTPPLRLLPPGTPAEAELTPVPEQEELLPPPRPPAPVTSESDSDQAPLTQISPFPLLPEAPVTGEPTPAPVSPTPVEVPPDVQIPSGGGVPIWGVKLPEEDEPPLIEGTPEETPGTTIETDSRTNLVETPIAEF